ncbi:hypothetical protein SEA_OTTAWA_48 [Arthrobacter phage Ottawa]|nr:hypothetical protein SEA_KHARCHO_48 [Arthrobacter phage Kharcho]WIC89280.1 hypothetical protein SEA_OTTAWA_48 [Arthrobacter phage Ottawa]
MADAIAFLQTLFPTTMAGGGLFGIYMYFRKVQAAIMDDLRKTIVQKDAEIDRLWAENRSLRGELHPDHDKPKDPSSEGTK